MWYFILKIIYWFCIPSVTLFVRCEDDSLDILNDSSMIVDSGDERGEPSNIKKL